MFQWRITKYNPKNRNSHGAYLIDSERTSYSDVGEKVEYEEYLQAEKAYIQAIILFMECNRIEQLKIATLEMNLSWDENDPYLPNSTKEIFMQVKDGLFIDKAKIVQIAQLILREKLWCKLESDQMFVHFGWDYYMYIGSVNACQKYIEEIQASGLFVEKCLSPYLECD